MNIDLCYSHSAQVSVDQKSFSDAQCSVMQSSPSVHHVFEKHCACLHVCVSPVLMLQQVWV